LQTGGWWFDAIMVTLAFGATSASAGASNGRRRWLVGKLDHFNDVLSSVGVWDAHVGGALVVLDVLVVEPRAVAGLPRCCAHHAELSSASALCC
jgi:hypothetical protein